jgi:hypothetical protein
VTDILWACAYFFLAYAIGRLQLSWLAAYHAKSPLRAANIDALLVGLHYVPLVMLIREDNWWVVPAEMGANWVASYTTIKKEQCSD